MCVCLWFFGLGMRLCVLRVIYCAMSYGLRSVFVCVCVCSCMCQCDVFVIWCVLVYGVLLCLCAWAWGFNVFVCIVCEF